MHLSKITSYLKLWFLCLANPYMQDPPYDDPKKKDPSTIGGRKNKKR